MTLLPEDVQDVVRLLDTLPFDEVDLETTDLRVAFRRVGGGWTHETQVRRQPNLVDAKPEHDEAVRDAAATQPHAGIPEGLAAVAAPLLGTFYRAPKPGAPPYVEVGSRVEPDTVVGLIETMKLFNSVYANVSGTVVEFLVSDAEFAQKDAPLLLVEPDGD